MACRARCSTSPSTGRGTSRESPRRWRHWSRRAPTSTPESAVRGPHEETPLHWAASSNDVEALDALLDAGADIEVPGAVLGGGSPLADARGFKNWEAAFRLFERGARVTLVDAATLGLADRVEACFGGAAPPSPDEVSRAFWGACHGGRDVTAAFLLDRGADLNWVPPWEPLTPLDAAAREDAADLMAWLRARGAKSAADLTG